MRRAGADALLIGSAIMDGDVRRNTEGFVRSESHAPGDDGTATDIDTHTTTDTSPETR
jgi:indole-3-glycerol phosphate synthase